jgi:hypothetical protein
LISRPIKGCPPPRACTAAPPRCHARRLGELSPRPSTELCTHTYAFLVTYCNSPSHALHRPHCRLTGSQDAAADAARHHRPSSPEPPPLTSRPLLHPR